MERFYGFMRLAHWVLGAFLLLVLSFFAFTGLVMNHGWFKEEPVKKEWVGEVPATLPLPALSDDPNAPVPALAKDLTAWLAEHSDYPLSSYQMKVNYPEIILEYKGPGSEATLVIDSESRAVEYQSQREGLITFMNNLHKGRHVSPAWARFMDIVALLTLVVTASGLVLLVYYRRGRPSTWLWLSSGLTIPLFLILYGIHY